MCRFFFTIFAFNDGASWNSTYSIHVYVLNFCQIILQIFCNIEKKNYFCINKNDLPMT